MFHYSRDGPKPSFSCAIGRPRRRFNTKKRSSEAFVVRHPQPDSTPIPHTMDTSAPATFAHPSIDSTSQTSLPQRLPRTRPYCTRNSPSCMTIFNVPIPLGQSAPCLEESSGLAVLPSCMVALDAVYRRVLLELAREPKVEFYK